MAIRALMSPALHSVKETAARMQHSHASRQQYLARTR